MNALEMFIMLFGGLGLFLYGMNIMGDGLQNIAGNRLKGFFEKLTSNPIKGVLTGAIITAIIQSSSATTVMIVGFVNAGLMNLYQSTAVIMGANIGTTITGQLFALNIQSVTPIFIGVGSIVWLASKRNYTKQLGCIILGFGILFLGMDLMKTSMHPLQESQIFLDLLKRLDGNIVLGILAGAFMTALLQSSSAATGILIALSGSGVMNITMIIPILFGCNIGTCVTSLISSIGTSTTAKKAAIIHLLFNVIGTLIFIPLFHSLAWLVTDSALIGSSDIKRQIANALTIFNVGNTIILIPFISILVKVANKLIKDNDDDEERYGVKYIDERLLDTPSIAIAQAIKDIERMGDKSKKNLSLAVKSFILDDRTLAEKVYKNGKLINVLEEDLTKYLVELSKLDIPDKDKENVVSLIHIINDIKRIDDYSQNISNLTNQKLNKKILMSNEAKNNLESILNLLMNSLDISVNMIGKSTNKKLDELSILEKKLNTLEYEIRRSHINRLNKGMCNATASTMFLDIVSNLQRISYHSLNTGKYAIKD